MGNIINKIVGSNSQNNSTNLKDQKSPQINQNIMQDKKNLNVNVVFEEIMDVKGAEKGAMLLSESIGKPRETYETIENIAPVSYGLIKKVKHKI